MKIFWLAALAAFPLVATGQIKIASATYGSNCGAPRDNAKNAVASECNNRSRCTYKVDFHVLGDPAPGCAKTFLAEWTCGASVSLNQRSLPAEAGFGSELKLDCPTTSFGSQVLPTPLETVGTQVLPPSLEMTAINPSQLIHGQPWTVHFRLTNNWAAQQTLMGWLEAVAYDESDPGKAHAINAKSYSIADVRVNQAAEASFSFSTTPSLGNAKVELTYFHISAGYAPGPLSADSVLPDVPPAVKAQLLANGNARRLTTAVSDLVVIPSEAERLAAVFDFDDDSCYPSAAVSDQGVVNPGLEEQATGIVSGCRAPEQLQTSHTYYREASIRKNGVDFAVRMYALYFMKDKISDLPVEAGHRHDWEFALVWTKNGAITHASYSHHGEVATDSISNLDRDADGHVKIVYHKGAATHEMRFAGANEQAENDHGRFFTPRLMNWYTMTNRAMSNQALRRTFNEHDYDQANCSVNDLNFPGEIAKHPPGGYPSAKEWKAAARNP